MLHGIDPNLTPDLPDCMMRMEIDDAPDEMAEVHNAALALIDAAKPDGAATGHIERQAFHARAAQAFAVVASTKNRPFGCFILRKGVIS